MDTETRNRVWQAIFHKFAVLDAAWLLFYHQASDSIPLVSKCFGLRTNTQGCTHVRFFESEHVQEVRVTCSIYSVQLPVPP